jgi:hypothetical protein
MATDESGADHSVALVQHAHSGPRRPDTKIPGRLYFNEEPVPIRSTLEIAVVWLLRSAEVRCGGSPSSHEDNTRALTAQVIAFVQSDEYVAFGERVEQAGDNTRYSVWVVWDDTTFGKAVVKTRHLLGLGMREAQEHVQLGRPVATGLRAPDVVDWARRFREADVGVRVDPAFGWRLP